MCLSVNPLEYSYKLICADLLGVSLGSMSKVHVIWCVCVYVCVYLSPQSLSSIISRQSLSTSAVIR